MRIDMFLMSALSWRFYTKWFHFYSQSNGMLQWKLNLSIIQLYFSLINDIINADLVRWVLSRPEPGPTKRPVSSHCSACPTWFFSTIPNHYSKHISGKNCLKFKCCCNFLVVVDACTWWMHFNIKTMKQATQRFTPQNDYF